MNSQSSAKFTTFSLDLVTTYGAGDNSKARLGAVMPHKVKESSKHQVLFLNLSGRHLFSSLTPSSFYNQTKLIGGTYGNI